MKPAKSTKKKPAPKPKMHKINLEYVNEIIDESIATMMAMRSLIEMLVAEKEARK